MEAVADAPINDRPHNQMQQPLVTDASGAELRQKLACAARRWKTACMCCAALAAGLAAACVTLYLYEEHILFPSASPPSSPPAPPPYFKPIVPTVQLNNGVVMPMISLGTWDFNGESARDAVRLALKVGFSHIDTAWKYGNQAFVGAALDGVERETYFLTTKVYPSTRLLPAVYNATMHLLHDDLRQLNKSYVDLVLQHWPPIENTKRCDVMQEEWRAFEDFYKAGNARAIGVSNYCPSSISCIRKKATVLPAVNQVAYHVGMGTGGSIETLRTYCDNLGIVVQAYSPLGGWTGGNRELISGKLVTEIGAAHGKSGAQVSLHWLFQHGLPFSTKSASPKHLEEDLRIFEMRLTGEEMARLDNATSPSGHYSFECHH